MGQLVFQAALGGQVALSGPNTASSFTVAVPAVTGTMVTTGDTATVTSTMISGPLTSAVGGTGVNNGSATLTLAGNVTHSGAFTQTFTATGNTSLTLPTSGTLQTTTGSLASNTGLPLTTGVTGTLPVANGGTNLTSFTANGVVYASSTSALATGSALTFDGANLGIGTSSPAYKLDVRVTGTGNVANFQSDSGPNIRFTGTETSGRTYQIGEGLVTSGSFSIYDATGSAERLVINSSGNLGLGVTPSAWASPFKALQIGTTGNFFASNSGNTSVTYNAYFNGTNYIYQVGDYATRYSSSSSGHLWFTAPSGTAGGAVSFTQAMTLDTSGNFYVGASGTIANIYQSQVEIQSATHGLNVVCTGGSSYQGITVWSNNSANTANFINFNVSAGAGRTGVGSITYNGTLTVYATTSDYRLKTVIGTITDAGNRIDALEPIEYDWKTGGSTRGFLAHKFAEVYPSSVSGEKDAVDKDGKPVYQAMQASTPEVIADLVAEIQSLRKRLTALENK